MEDSFKPGSQPEVLEVIAPRRQGKRFWLTLDHPITLAINLPRGHGIVDATGAETAIALAAKPVSQAEAAPAERSERKHSARHAAAAPVNARPAAANAAPPEAPAEAKPIAQAPAPKPEPAPPSKPEPVAAAPKPRLAPPAASAAPTGLDPAKTQATVRGHLGEIQRCYERAKMDDPELKGRITMRIAVSATGTVTSAAVESSTLGSTAAESCMKTTIAGWKFPAPAGGPAIISYPFNLR
jgi:outer membrane biosynthesis protein TonB